MSQHHARFIDSIATFGAGAGIIVLDTLKLGTVVLGFAGAVLAVLGGWHAYKAKRLEVRLREMEMDRLEKGLAHAAQSLKSDHDSE